MGSDVRNSGGENFPLARVDGGELRRRELQRRVRPHASHGEDAAKKLITPAFLWWTFRQWWMYIVPAGLILAGAAATGVIVTYKPDYRASAMLMIEDSPEYVAFPDQVNGGGSRRYVETQIQLMRSSIVLGPVLAKKEIVTKPSIANAPDRLAQLQNSLSIAPIGNSELYNVSYVSKSPQEAADIANAVVEEYLTMQRRDDSDRYQRVVELLEREQNERQVAVERLRQNVTGLAKEVVGNDTFGHDTTLEISLRDSPLNSTYHELTRIEVDRAVLSAQIRSMEENAGNTMADEESGLLDLKIESNETVRNYQNIIDGLAMTAEAHKAALRPEAVANDQRYKTLLAQMQKQKTALEEFKTQLRKTVVAEREQQLRGEQELSIRKMRGELSLLDSRRKLLEEKFKSELENVKGENAKSITLEFARAELEREESIFEMIAGRKLAMQTELNAPPRVKLRQSATVPVKPLSPLPYKMLFMACSGALAAPFGLALLREMTIRRISDVEQLSRDSSVKVIGEVAHFPIRRAAANIQLLPSKARRQMFLYLDSVDSLRTNIALSEHGERVQVMVVTSAAAGEGKTCLSTSLTMSLARANKKPTLIIDADLRAPDVATVLSVRARPGLAELLRGEAALEDVVQRVGKTDAYVLPAGRLKGNPHHAIREELIGPLLDKLRTQYSSIVIDTPPVFGGSESLLLAKLADASIISVLCDVSRSKQLEVVVDRLERTGANVLGAVLNGKRAYSYANYYGYGSYSGRLEELDD